MTRRQSNTAAGIAAILLMQYLCTTVLWRALERTSNPARAEPKKAPRLPAPVQQECAPCVKTAGTSSEPRREAALEDLTTFDGAPEMYRSDTGHSPSTGRALPLSSKTSS